jgi:LPXTG-motif cell wall-anchored protein
MIVLPLSATSARSAVKFTDISCGIYEWKGVIRMRVTIKLGVLMALCLALLPALAGAAPPQPQGKLVYDDDFSNPKKSGLEDNLTATDYSRGFHAPGVYHLKDLKPKETHWSIFPNQSYGQLTVELDVWDNSDDFKGDISQGVIVRAQDNTHFYAVLIDPRTGEYSVRKQSSANASTDLIAPKASPLIKQQSDVNHLRVDADGSKFTIYLNGEQLDTFSDSAYAKGSIGLIASNVDAATNHMHYDNVKVYSTEAQAAQPTSTTPTNLPKTGQPGGAEPLILAGFALLLLLLGLWTRKIKN